MSDIRVLRVLAVLLVWSAFALTLSALTIAPPASAAGSGNLVSYTFDRSLSGWSAPGRAQIKHTRLGRSGSRAMKVVTPWLTTARVTDTPNRVTRAVKGSTYTTTAWVRTQTPALTVTVRVREVRGRTVVGESVRSVRLGTSRWRQLSVKHLARQSGTTLDVTLYSPRMTSKRSFIVDDVAVRRWTPAPRPVTETPAGRLSVGVQFHGMWQSYTDPERLATLDRLDAMGAEWVRLDVSWAMIQPTGPEQYDLGWGVPFVDKVVDQAHSRGLKVLVMFWMTPGWANGNAGDRVAPSNPDTYANAIEWASRRWAGEVQAWEVWNEPNLDAFWSTADPAAYTRLLCPAYRAVKRGNPGADVVFGGVAHNDDDWIRAAYDAGAKGCFDAMATHPYVGPSDASPRLSVAGEPWEFPHLREVRRLMTSRGDDKPIWATEFGWSTHANTGAEKPWEKGVTPQVQAQYTIDALTLLERDHPYVENAFVYNERDKETGNRHQDGFGILRRDLEPKPVYWALKDYLS